MTEKTDYKTKPKWQELLNYAKWLYEPDDVPLPESCLKYLNHKIIISSFCQNKETNNIFNFLLNNSYVYNIKIEELAYFIKEVVKSKGITYNQIWWFSNLDYVEPNDKETYKLCNQYEKNLISDLVNKGILNEEDSPRFRTELKNSLSKKKSNNIASTKEKKKENFMTFDEESIKKEKNVKIVNNLITLPEKYYTDYSVLDIQEYDNKIIYIFKNNKTNEKEYFKCEPIYYYFTKQGAGKHVESIKDLQIKTYTHTFYKGFHNNITNYESDINVSSRHRIDYYINKQKYNIENKYDINKMYLDIEVLSDSLAFPEPRYALYPIVLISVKEVINNTNIINNVFVLNEEKIKFPEYTDNGYKILSFDNERDLILNFANLVKNTKCETITAWNSMFDMGTIINRMKKLNININFLSPLNIEPLLDFDKNYCDIPGLIQLDLLNLYKNITENSKDFYSLDFISQLELGEQKLEKGKDFYLLWKEDKMRCILYNVDDSEKIYKLDNKLQIINYFNVITNFASCPWTSIGKATRIFDSVLMRFAKQKGLCLRSKIKEDTEQSENKGAYVYNPKPGLYENLYMVDFSKQYPSTMRTLNIGPNTLYATLEDENQIKDLFSENKNVKYNVIFNPLYNPTKRILTYDEIKFMMEKEELMISCIGSFYYKQSKLKSILYEPIQFFGDERNKFKALLKKDKTNITLKNQERGVKELNNAGYGYLATPGSRINHPKLVNSITLTTQKINKFCAIIFSHMLSNNKHTLTQEEIKQLFIDKLINQYWDSVVDEPFIIYGDTDSIYPHINDKKYNSWEEAKERGEEIRKCIVDEVINKFLPKTFNIDNKEVVLSLGYQGIGYAYFTSVKKKYLVNYLDGDHKGLVVKGFETRRSNVPELTREFLMNVFKMLIIDFKTEDEIRNYIDQCRIILKDKISKFDKSIGAHISYSKDLDEYKKIPSHVIAMEFWNLTQYKIFAQGSKAYKFDVKYYINKMDEKDKNALDTLKKKYNLKSDLKIYVIPDDYKGEIPKYIVPDEKHTMEVIWDNIIEGLFPSKEEKRMTLDDFI